MATLVEKSGLLTANGQSLLEIWDVSLGNSTIKFHEPFFVPYTVLEKGTAEECFFAEFQEVGISAVGVDIEELRSCLHSDIRMTWERVFRKSVSELTQKDKAIKQRFLEFVQEISNG